MYHSTASAKPTLPTCPPPPPPQERFGTTSFSQNRHPTRPDQTPVQIPLRHRCLTVHLLFQPRSRRFCSISASHPDTPIREFIRGVLALFLTAPFRHPSSSHPAIEPSRAPPLFFFLSPSLLRGSHRTAPQCMRRLVGPMLLGLSASLISIRFPLRTSRSRCYCSGLSSVAGWLALRPPS